MVARNQDARSTAYTVTVDARTVDARTVVTTGISATDRAHTLRPRGFFSHRRGFPPSRAHAALHARAPEP
ncbi:3,4-dihydroxy-2-butanone-4-phosphate synthase [Actinomadura vinacea]|uniref:3,4-dihydroxy-2-butanone-4-phosphate synthase n=1 Tax=Actinomadura vinacea TaxID=115336 RepID=UPI0031E47D4A